MPIFFSSIVQQSYNIIDALIVGNYAGKEALASVDSTYVIIKLLINVFISVAAGGSIIIAQYYGAKKDEQVRKTVAIFRMDVTGVALATVTAQFVAAFLIGYYMIRSNHSYSICFRLSLYEREKLLLILKTGIPMGVTTVLYAISNMYMQGSINSFGTNGIAAWAICGKLDFLIWVIVDTMGITVTTFMAQNFGAKKFDRMRQVLSNALPLTTFYVFYIGGELLSGAIRGRGETFYPMLLTLVGTCLSRIFWIKWIVPKNPSFYLVMWGYPASWIFTTSIFILYYWYFSRRKNNLIHSTN